MVWPFVDPLPIEQGKTREQKGVTGMYEPRRNAATLLGAQLRFAEIKHAASIPRALRDAVEDWNAVRS